MSLSWLFGGDVAPQEPPADFTSQEEFTKAYGDSAASTVGAGHGRNIWNLITGNDKDAARKAAYVAAPGKWAAYQNAQSEAAQNQLKFLQAKAAVEANTNARFDPKNPGAFYQQYMEGIKRQLGEFGGGDNAPMGQTSAAPEASPFFTDAQPEAPRQNNPVGELRSLSEDTPTTMDRIAPLVRANVDNAMKVAGMATPFDDMFQQAGDKYGLDPNLLKAGVYQESSFGKNTNHAPNQFGGTAQGIAGITPEFAQQWGIRDPLNAGDAIDGMGKFYRAMFDKGLDVRNALKSYFGGESGKHWGPKTDAYPNQVLGRYEEITGRPYDAGVTRVAASNMPPVGSLPSMSEAPNPVANRMAQQALAEGRKAEIARLTGHDAESIQRLQLRDRDLLPGMKRDPRTGQVYTSTGQAVGNIFDFINQTEEAKQRATRVTNAEEIAGRHEAATAEQAQRHSDDLSKTSYEAGRDFITGLDSTNGRKIVVSKEDLAQGKAPATFLPNQDNIWAPIQQKELVESNAEARKSQEGINKLRQLVKVVKDNKLYTGTYGGNIQDLRKAVIAAGLDTPAIRNAAKAGDIVNEISNEVAGYQANLIAQGRVPLGLFNQVSGVKPSLFSADPEAVARPIIAAWQRNVDENAFKNRYYGDEKNWRKLDATDAFINSVDEQKYMDMALPQKFKALPTRDEALRELQRRRNGGR